MLSMLKDQPKALNIMHSIKMSALAIAAALALSGCAGSNKPLGLASSVELTDLDTLPSNENAGFYKIGPQEILEISVVGSDLLSSKFITDERGRVQMPLAGEVNLSGLTPAAASEVIANSLRGEYVIDPQVIVIPEDLDRVTLSIGGQVERPGAYPVDEDMTLMRAVNLAGGRGEFAKLEEVLVFREVQGQRYIGVYNLEAIQRGNYADPRLYANDIVMVGDSAAQRRLATILQFIPVLSSAVILIDRLGR